jgi:hypothetical protein
LADSIRQTASIARWVAAATSRVSSAAARSDPSRQLPDVAVEILEAVRIHEAVSPAARALRCRRGERLATAHRPLAALARRQTSTSVLRVASAIGFDVKVLKKSCVSSIAWMLPSSITRQAPWSLLNFGSKCRPGFRRRRASAAGRRPAG